MTVVTTNEQTECLAVIDALGIREVLKPLVPNRACDGIIQLSEDSFLIGSNELGKYTLHLIEGATKKEAFAFLDEIRKEFVIRNPRIHFVGASPAQTVVN